MPDFTQPLIEQRRTMRLFRNSSTVSFFLCGVRTAQPSQTQSLNTVLDMLLLLYCMKMVCFLTSLFL